MLYLDKVNHQICLKISVEKILELFSKSIMLKRLNTAPDGDTSVFSNWYSSDFLKYLATEL